MVERTHTTTPRGAKKVPRAYAHSNDAIRKIKTPDNLPTLDHIKGRNIVTIDLDGTFQDPWACCGHRGNFGIDPDTGCAHTRQDTLDWVNQLCAEHNALPVILSWRAGLVDVSAKWLNDIGFDAHALFIPGSDDDVSGYAIDKFTRAAWGGGQVQFKASTILTLQVFYGCTIVGATDDNVDVCEALTNKLGLGASVVRQCTRLVTVEDHEWRAGYIGAPKPKFSTWTRPADGDWYNAEPADDWTSRRFESRTLWDNYGDDTFTSDDVDSDEDLLDQWGITIGDRVRHPNLGIDGVTGPIVDVADGLVLFCDDETGEIYEAEPDDLLVDDFGNWTPVELAIPAPAPESDRLPNGTTVQTDNKIGVVVGSDGNGSVHVDFGDSTQTRRERSCLKIRLPRYAVSSTGRFHHIRFGTAACGNRSQMSDTTAVPPPAAAICGNCKASLRQDPYFKADPQVNATLGVPHGATVTVPVHGNVTVVGAGRSAGMKVLLIEAAGGTVPVPYRCVAVNGERLTSPERPRRASSRFDVGARVEWEFGLTSENRSGEVLDHNDNGLVIGTDTGVQTVAEWRCRPVRRAPVFDLDAPF